MKDMKVLHKCSLQLKQNENCGRHGNNFELFLLLYSKMARTFCWISAPVKLDSMIDTTVENLNKSGDRKLLLPRSRRQTFSFLVLK